jgi:hypothetical protein
MTISSCTDNKKNNAEYINSVDKYCENGLYPLKINTYDGSRQAMHPKVLYFKNSWNGWKYWMSYTPYPYSNYKFENPSIAVSQNGIEWGVPKGLKNPVIKAPNDVKKGGHYSDPDLVMNGQTMELWYRYNPANKNGRWADNEVNCIYRITSKNGVNWSMPTLIFKDKFKYYSPAVLCENGLYKVWFSDSGGKMYLKESRDLKKWSKPISVHVTILNYIIWHQDIIKTDLGYEIIFSAYHKGYFHNQSLYYSISSDGINFKNPVLILSPSKWVNQHDNKMMYRSSIININGVYKIYYSAMDIRREWHIFVTNFNSTNIY